MLRHIPRWFWVALVLLPVSGFIHAAEPPAAAAGAPAATPSYAGDWLTTWGPMKLTQNGNAVDGTYGAAAVASIKGTVTGGKLTFTYKEPAAEGEGWFELADGGASFSGKWRENGQQIWGDWKGARAAAAAQAGPATFDGAWLTTWGPMKLEQTGDTVVGTYGEGANVATLSGKVANGKLTFTYKEPLATGEGWFQLGAGNNTFSGKWRQNGQEAWGDWQGQRVVAAAPPVGAPPAAPPAAGKGTYDGLWETTYGPMKLKQTGDLVEGTYGGGTGDGPATITGKVANGKFTFTYKEPLAVGEGSFQLAADGQSFNGQWREKGQEAWQPWIGKRPAPAGGADVPPPPGAARPDGQGTFAGAWQTTYGLMMLTQKGDTIEGSYGGPAGNIASISGKLANGKFTFTYKEPDATGEGWFELGADGKSFSGKWRQEGTQVWAEWRGQRAAGAEAPQLQPRNFSGLWETTWGRMRLHQEGDTVRGTYLYAGKSTIEGKLDKDGRTLTFSYNQPDGEKGTGTYTLAEDAQSFSGSWKTEAGGGAWGGKRVQPRPGITWLVVLEAHWEGGLAEPEYSYGHMLRSFFTRVPNVQVRHRFVHDEADLRRFASEVAFLAEPVVLYISSHGTAEGVSIGPKPIGADVLAECLQGASNIKLLHFGACLVGSGEVPAKLHKAMNGTRFPISGFKHTADWAGSALVDFAYLEMIFSYNMPPARAAEQVQKMMTFARDKREAGTAIAPAGLVVIDPPRDQTAQN